MKKILIIEDEKSLAEALRDKITSNGYQVIIANDGEEGLRAAKSEDPDLILLDIILPKKDGMTVLEELRGTDWGSGIPVIILTNLLDGDKVISALKAGVRDYLIKSDWKINDVVKLIKEKIGG